MSDLLAAARAEAVRLQHDYVGTEHLFLALVRLEDPSLITILGAFDQRPAALRERIEKRSPQGRGTLPNPDDLPLRSGAKRVLEAARASAGGGEAGPSQVLAALLTDGKGVVASSLADLGVPVARVRETLGIAEPGKSDRPKAERPERAELERQEKPGRAEKGERRDRPPRPERTEGAERAERKERQKAEQQERARGRPDGRPREGGGPTPSAPATPPRIAPVHEPFFTWRRLPLLFIPLSLFLARGGDYPPWLVFTAACVAVLPLAGYMGDATEHLAARSGPTLGGFLNATFGNAAELIIALVALQAGLIDLVKASITGSILGNLLLILGLSLVAGGLGRPVVRFNRTAVGVSAGMLALAVTGLVFPGIFHYLHPDAATITELHFSEAVAVVLALTYGCSLLFSLKTHSRLFAGEPHPLGRSLWSVPRAMTVLGLATVGVALESEILVHAVESLTRESQLLSETFLGLIVIPLIGNAAEHATAVVVARKGKLDLALQIALGSSTQVALLVAPILVFAGALLGPGPSGSFLNLVFTPLEVVAVGLATLLGAIVTLDGESHWFEGIQLLALYALVAIAAFFI